MQFKAQRRKQREKSPSGQSDCSQLFVHGVSPVKMVRKWTKIVHLTFQKLKVHEVSFPKSLMCA